MKNKINYLGYSYGTALGQIYSTLFPKNYRSIVIDGVLNVGLDPLQTTGDQAIAFENAFRSFFEYCRRNACKYSAGQDPEVVFANLENQIENKPIGTLNGEIVDTSQFMIGTSVFLYGGEGNGLHSMVRFNNLLLEIHRESYMATNFMLDGIILEHTMVSMHRSYQFYVRTANSPIATSFLIMLQR